jgi:WXG100 family type VII secretion target
MTILRYAAGVVCLVQGGTRGRHHRCVPCTRAFRRKNHGRHPRHVRFTVRRLEPAVLGIVDGLVGGDWSGAASQSFQELYSQWDQSAIQLKESLQGISELLSQAALSYEESENSISGTFRG